MIWLSIIAAAMLGALHRKVWGGWTPLGHAGATLLSVIFAAPAIIVMWPEPSAWVFLVSPPIFCALWFAPRHQFEGDGWNDRYWWFGYGYPLGKRRYPVDGLREGRFIDGRTAIGELFLGATSWAAFVTIEIGAAYLARAILSMVRV